MDGWGVAPPGPDNAVSLARHAGLRPARWREYPHGVLDASGPAVGLPPGQMGNSEVGHLNIGAGRVVYQDLTRISLAIEDGSFFENRVLAPGLRQGRGAAAAACTSWAWSPGAACTATWATSSPASSWRRARRSATSSCTRSSTAATRRRGAPRATSRPIQAGHGPARRRPLRRRQRPLLRHGPRHALGPRQAGLRRPRATARASSPPTPRRRSTPPTPAARTTSSCGPTIVAPEHDSRVRDGDVCLFFNFRPDRARELTRAFTERGFAEFDRGAAPAQPSTS